MSNIDDQIKFLQIQKKKIEFLQLINELIVKQPDIDKAVQEEIASVMHEFIDSQINLIENGREMTIQPKTEVGQFTQEECSILRGVIAKVSTKVQAPTITEKPVKRPILDESLKAKRLEFAQEYKHLAEQSVVVRNPTTKQDVEGLVIGMDYPNLILQLNNGAQIKVPAEHLV